MVVDEAHHAPSVNGIAPRQSAQAKLYTAFLIGSVIVALQAYHRHLTAYMPDEWGKLALWTLLLVFYLLTRFMVFHRDYAVLNLGDILVCVRGMRAHLLIYTRGAEMMAWLILARMASLHYILVWTTIVATADLLVCFFTKLCVPRAGFPSLHEEIRESLPLDFRRFLSHKQIGASVIAAFGWLWLIWFGTQEFVLWHLWPWTSERSDMVGTALILLAVFLVTQVIYDKHPNSFFGYDRELKPSNGAFPAHGLFSTGGEIGSVMACATLTGSISGAAASFAQIDNPSVIPYLLLACFLMYRAMYFQRDYLLHSFRCSFRIGELGKQAVDPRHRELRLELLASALWMVLALSISPSVITWIVIESLLILDLLKCLASRTSLLEIRDRDAGKLRLDAMFQRYFFVDIILLIVVGLAGAYYFSPVAAQGLHQNAAGSQTRELLGSAAIVAVMLFGMWPYRANRMGVKASGITHTLVNKKAVSPPCR